MDWEKVLISAITGAIIGSVLTLVTSVLLDRRRQFSRYKALLKVVYKELLHNRDRIMAEKKKLPNEIISKIESGGLAH